MNGSYGAGRAPEEPPCKRDVGPFTDSTQAMTQFTTQMHGLDAGLVFRQGALIAVQEACMLAGLELTEHERARLLADLSSEAGVIVAGLIIRARLNGEATAAVIGNRPGTDGA